MRERIVARLLSAIELKNVAVSNNLDVPDEVLSDLTKAEFALARLPAISPPAEAESERTTRGLEESAKALMRHATDIDKAIRDLTSITYPTTIDTLRATRMAAIGVTDVDAEHGRKAVTRVKQALIVIGIGALILAVSDYWFLLVQVVPLDDATGSGAAKTINVWSAGVMAVLLGVMGAVVYILFNLLGVISEGAFNARDEFGIYARLVLGGVLGFVLWLGLSQGNFVGEANSKSPTLLLPFVVGFSTKLVVGIINQVIRVIQLTIGIDDTGTQLLDRGRRRTVRRPMSGL